MNAAKNDRPFCHWHRCQKRARKGSVLCAEHQAIEDRTSTEEGYRGRLFIVTEEEATS